MATTALVGLHRRLSVDHCGDDLAVLGDGLLTNDDPVAVGDRGVDHRVTGDAEEEERPLADELTGEREDVLNRLLGEDRTAGGDAPDDGDVGGRGAVV